MKMLIGIGVVAAVVYIGVGVKIFIEGHGTVGHALKNALLWPLYNEWP